MTSAGTHLLEAAGLGKTYTTGPTAVVALHGVDLAVEPGTLVVVQGRSGSGKTTLLNLLGGLDQPTSGTVRLDGDLVSEMGEEELSAMRRSRVGFIFQAFGLIPILTAAENVEVPLRLLKTDPARRRERARVLLELVGLGDRSGHRPSELSGGEQQRVAIARALANRPKLLLADEPTGQLDSVTGKGIIELLTALVHSEGIAAIVATHDPAPLAVADRVVELRDGRLSQRR
ncbi:MAG TPA: ABC transporter ATP-binding protein [Acidimicrobiia bacterium]|jgi:putative ABC transport system ATP-binding protein|nr:ABC transporter ATP-binding protein [Acidimicrobiia bacterium]